jgi:SAM-dependent methyltransferase
MIAAASSLGERVERDLRPETKLKMKQTKVAQIKRAITVYQNDGLAAVGLRLMRRVRHVLGYDDPDHARWLKEKLAVDADFDAAKGTETGGVQHIFGLKIVGANARHGVSHIASDPKLFSELMAQLGVDFKHYTFIDLGSGKGRALILAAEFPFRRIIGVEFAIELHEAAKVNFSKLAVAKSANSRVELICGDAAKYDFPQEPLIIYMFNPFGSAIVRRIAENALASWRRFPRPIQILYMNPVHLKDLIDVGWLPSNNAHFARLLPPSSGVLLPR